MVTVIAISQATTDKCVFQFAGLSGDAKPTRTDMANGSQFIEMNTSKLYFWDATNSTWREWGGSNA